MGSRKRSNARRQTSGRLVRPAGEGEVAPATKDRGDSSRAPQHDASVLNHDDTFPADEDLLQEEAAETEAFDESSLQPVQIPWREVAAAGILALLAMLPFYRVLWHGFIELDDAIYVRDNAKVLAGLTADGVSWAFRNFSASNWHPLTWISHMLDAQVWGAENIGGHHLTNVLLHGANTLFLWYALRVLTGAYWRSAAVAAIFAVHPLHVESVAWISERKDVLSACFGFLAIWAYAVWVRRGGTKAYALVLICHALSLMAKPMLVTLPCLLLLLDVWPLGRVAWLRKGQTLAHPPAEPAADGPRGMAMLVVEKLPLFVMSAAASVLTLKAQSATVMTLESLPLGMRLIGFLAGIGFYVRTTIWPADLAVIYSYPSHWPAWQVIFGALALLGFTGLGVWQFRRRAYLLIGWLWYLGLLVPVIGLVQVGSQAYADRYAYVPTIGLLIMAVWSVPALADARIGSASWRAAVGAVAAIALVFAVATIRQTRWWDSSKAMFEHAIDVWPDNYVAHNLLAYLLSKEQDFDRARLHAAEELRLQKNYAVEHDFYGDELAKYVMRPDAEPERIAEAEAHFRMMLELNDRIAKPHNNLGTILYRMGRTGEAEQEFRRAIALDRGYADPRVNLSVVQRAAGRDDEAQATLREAIQVAPTNVDARVRLGEVLAALNRPAEAVGEYEAACRLAPESVDAWLGLGHAHIANQQLNEAMESWMTAAELDKTRLEAPKLMAAVYLASRQGLQAALLYSVVAKSEPYVAENHINLGRALAASGRFLEAKASFQEALRLEPKNALAAECLREIEMDIAAAGGAATAPQVGAP